MITGTFRVSQIFISCTLFLTVHLSTFAQSPVTEGKTSANEQASPLPATLSIGALRDNAEKSAVRVLAKLGESLSVDDKLVLGESSRGRDWFYMLSRQFAVDASDSGKFGGITLRYGVQLYSVGMQTDPLAPPRDDGMPVRKFDGDKLMHLFPIRLGVDTGRDFKNHDYLVEAGYIPALYRSGVSCFKLGGNPIVGVFGQLGRRYRESVLTDSSKPAESTGSLRRIKVEGKMGFLMSCLFRFPDQRAASAASPVDLILADFATWQIGLSSAGWRDFVEDRNYKKHELTLRVPAGNKKYVDLKREIGAAPAEFDTGTKFSANLTIEF